MLSRMLALGMAALVAGCIGVGPQYVYLFQEGENFSTDVLEYSPSGKYLAVHAKGRPGWYVLCFETPEGKFDQEFTTEAGTLRAWYFPPIAADRKKAPDEIHAPDLDYFVRNQDSPVFEGRAVKLAGTIHAEGEGTAVRQLKLDLTSDESPENNLKGRVRRELQYVSTSMPKMPEP